MSAQAPADTSSTSYKAQLLSGFIARHHAALRSSESDSQSESSEGDKNRPLMVSMQGPQGCGKSTLAAALLGSLEGKGLKTAVASLDDFYLPYSGLKALATSDPSNALLSGRGPPGTHDAPLLAFTLAEINNINNTSPPSSSSSSSSISTVNLPIFDKSLNEGYGDRSQSTIPVVGPIDVFLLEGWSLGFEPVAPLDLESCWKRGRVASRHPLSSLQTINDNLTKFSSAIHRYFDVHIAIRPQSYDHVYTWRLQQEHHMKRVNGGKGMSDEGVREFVDRYMPCYEIYGHQRVEGRKGIVLEFGENREVLSVEES